jgi:hypothetical protein
MKVENFDFCLESGFLWATISGFSVQACLMLEKRAENKIYAGKKFRYIKKIKKTDAGMDDGICGDVNEKSFDAFSKEKVIAAFLTEARKKGFLIV